MPCADPEGRGPRNRSVGRERAAAHTGYLAYFTSAAGLATAATEPHSKRGGSPRPCSTSPDPSTRARYRLRVLEHRRQFTLPFNSTGSEVHWPFPVTHHREVDLGSPFEKVRMHLHTPRRGCAPNNRQAPGTPTRLADSCTTFGGRRGSAARDEFTRKNGDRVPPLFVFDRIQYQPCCDLSLLSQRLTQGS